MTTPRRGTHVPRRGTHAGHGDRDTGSSHAYRPIDAGARDTTLAWYIGTSTLDGDAQARLTALLSRDERARHDRFLHEADRRSYAAAHALVRLALSHLLDCPASRLDFSADPNGRPLLTRPAGTGAAFSLSHTRGLVACAVAAYGRIGIDVERVDRRVDVHAIARSRFAAAEAAALERCAPAERTARFCELWTLKEAAMKATGLGLGLPLDAFAFDVAGTAVTPVIAAPFDGWEWGFLLMDVGGGYRLALAAAEPLASPPRLVAARPYSLPADLLA